MELLFAITLMCHLSFKTCDLHQSEQGFKDAPSCLMQLARDLHTAETKRPDSLGDLNYPRYVIFGLCRPRLVAMTDLAGDLPNRLPHED